MTKERAPRSTKPEKLKRLNEIVEHMIYQPEPYWVCIQWIQDEYGIGQAQAQQDFTEAKRMVAEVGKESFRDTLDEAVVFWRRMRKDAFLDGEKEVAMKAQREESKLLGHYVERQEIDLTGNITFNFGEDQ